jgi:hypothetical protein
MGITHTSLSRVKWALLMEEASFFTGRRGDSTPYKVITLDKRHSPTVGFQARASVREQELTNGRQRSRWLWAAWGRSDCLTNEAPETWNAKRKISTD